MAVVAAGQDTAEFQAIAIEALEVELLYIDQNTAPDTVDRHCWHRRELDSVVCSVQVLVAGWDIAVILIAVLYAVARDVAVSDVERSTLVYSHYHELDYLYCCFHRFDSHQMARTGTDWVLALVQVTGSDYS